MLFAARGDTTAASLALYDVCTLPHKYRGGFAPSRSAQKTCDKAMATVGVFDCLHTIIMSSCNRFGVGGFRIFVPFLRVNRGGKHPPVSGGHTCMHGLKGVGGPETCALARQTFVFIVGTRVTKLEMISKVFTNLIWDAT